MADCKVSLGHMQYDLPVRTLRNARDRHDAVGVGNAQFFFITRSLLAKEAQENVTSNV